MKIKRTLHQVPGSIKKTTTKHQFENVYSICLIDAPWHSFLQHFIDCTYTDVFSTHTVCIELAHSWQRLNSDWNTNEQRRNIFIHIFVCQRSIIHYKHEKCEPYKHCYQYNWKKSRLEHLAGQNRYKILTFLMGRLDGRNDVLDQTRTAERLVESSRAPARLSKFTSGSRPSSSRPGILRCLMMTQTLCWTFGKIYFSKALKSTPHCVQNAFGHLNHPGSHLSWRKECIIKMFSKWRPFGLEMHLTGWYLKNVATLQWNQTSQGTILQKCVAWKRR